MNTRWLDEVTESWRSFEPYQDDPSFLDPDQLEPNLVTFDDPATSDREVW